MPFTLGICAFNEEKTLPKTLPLMLSQIGNNQLILVAAGDETKRVSKEFSKKDRRIKVIEEEGRKGKAWGINQIMKNSKTDVVILTDADVLPEEGSFQQLLKHFNNDAIGLVSGRVVPLNMDKSIFTFFSHFALNTMHELRLNGYHKLPTGYLFAVRKSLYENLPICLSEDAMIGAMVFRKGFKFIYEPEAKVKVLYPTNIRDYFNQKVRTHYGHLEARRDYKLDFESFRPKGYILRIAGKYPSREKFMIFLYMIIEVGVWTKSWFDFKRHKSKWPIVESSKKI